jgi:hypothetical protein
MEGRDECTHHDRRDDLLSAAQTVDAQRVERLHHGYHDRGDKVMRLDGPASRGFHDMFR